MSSPPERPVVVYHGDCGFCRRWVARLRRWDRHGRLAFLPLQDPRATALTGVGRDALERSAHVVMPSGAVFAGAAAFHALCPFLPGGWLPHAFLRIPGALPVADRLYGWIARHWGPVGDRAGPR